MGHDLGDFIDVNKGPLHVEYSHNKYVVWSADELDQWLRLDSNEAVNLINILRYGLSLYDQEKLENIY